jgi:hypothetical protein
MIRVRPFDCMSHKVRAPSTDGRVRSFCLPCCSRVQSSLRLRPETVVFEQGSCTDFASGCYCDWLSEASTLHVPACVPILPRLNLCKSLSRVTFASGSCLKRIEEKAFSECESLQEIEIPVSVEDLCSRAASICMMTCD